MTSTKADRFYLRAPDRSRPSRLGWRRPSCGCGCSCCYSVVREAFRWRVGTRAVAFGTPRPWLLPPRFSHRCVGCLCLRPAWACLRALEMAASSAGDFLVRRVSCCLATGPRPSLPARLPPSRAAARPSFDRMSLGVRVHASWGLFLRLGSVLWTEDCSPRSLARTLLTAPPHGRFKGVDAP
jgi:hypothetical protein